MLTVASGQKCDIGYNKLLFDPKLYTESIVDSAAYKIPSYQYPYRLVSMGRCKLLHKINVHYNKSVRRTQFSLHNIMIKYFL